MFKKISDFLAEYLRINAIKRMLTIVDVRVSEIAGLIGFAVLFAVFEGIGLSLLLPILQYAERGRGGVAGSSDAMWGVVSHVLAALHLPLALPVLLIIAFTPILLRQGVFYANAWYSAVVSARIGMRMQIGTLDTVMDADPEFFERHPVGDLVGVVIAQTASAGTAVLSGIKLVSIILLMALYTAILLAISAPLTVIAVAFAVLVALLVRANVRQIREFGIKAADTSQEMMWRIVERLTMMRLVKLRDQERSESRLIERYSEAMRRISIRQTRLGALMEVSADPVLMLSVFATLYVGISELGMTLAQLGLLLFVLTRLNAKIKEFNQSRQVISANIAGLLLVKQMTDDARASNTIKSGPEEFSGVKRQVVLESVCFGYPEIDQKRRVLSVGKEVLKDISLTIPAGSFTALVGRSGAGKSTLVELLPRLRDVTSGSITIDDSDIRTFQVGSLRRGIGYMTQSALLFNDTVRGNLTYGLQYEPTEIQIKEALAGAFADFVLELPEGLDTMVGDRGVRFSGGERQRIALARVLLEDTSVLILDEPTSSLDSESEGYIQAALNSLRHEKTIIVIAHRLATVMKADQLVVLEEGRIVEQGTHEDLVVRGGAYRKLFETQLLS